MTIIHTIAGTRFSHGGTSRSVPALCEAISHLSGPVHFLTTRPADPSAAFNVPGTPVITHLVDESSQFGRMLVGPGFQRVLRKVQLASPTQQGAFLIHDHGIWLSPNHAVAVYARRFKQIRVVSPRGMLSDWAINRGRLKKRLAWWAYQKADLASAEAFHVTSPEEAAEVRALGLKQPIAIIPNGVSFPLAPIERKPDQGRYRMLFLSRIHPKKGLMELVRAWDQSHVTSDWELVIAGPDERGYQKEIEAEVRSRALTDRIRFAGPVSDSDKWRSYADADLFILPSFSENFGIVIAEALAAGLPVITTTGTPWSELPKRDCGWWVEPNVDDLSTAISVATSLSDERRKMMGDNGREWVEQSFTWTAAAKKMVDFYSWLTGHQDRPQFVELAR